MQKNILFIPLDQQGHINPTLPIAADLIAAGFKVTYITVSQYEQCICAHGADLCRVDGVSTIESEMGHTLKDICFNADLVLVDSILYQQRAFRKAIEQLRVCPYSTSLPNWNEPKNRDALGWVLCAPALEIPKFRSAMKGDYLEPGVLQKDIRMVARQQPVSRILISFGTRSIRHRRLFDHYRLSAQLAAHWPEYEFILTAVEPVVAQSVHWPDNLQLLKMVDQPDLLRSCQAFVTHGGLGSIREAIYAEVPMLVLPSFGDQFFNAMRVRYHGIGEALFDDQQTIDHSRQILEKAIGGMYSKPLHEMRQHFMEAHAARISFSRSEEFLRPYVP
jgi:UDP:flavonoid glycosyltransferase YjiC (YdhE family)